MSGRSRWPHVGAILAGGGSVRMGRPKERLELPDGRTMIEAVAEAMAAVVAHVVVVGGGEVAAYTYVPDLRSDQGPLGGLEALLASGLAREYLVCPCDLPLMTTAVLSALLAPTDCAATVPRLATEPGPRPLPARFDATALATVREHLDRGQRSMRQLLRAIDPHVVTLTARDAAALTNVNTPSDYVALRDR